jgi:phage shock protein PspC (stress-responsive transcriptional regulator)
MEGDMAKRDRNTVRGPLRRSRRHRIIAGVCGGLAEWLGWSPTVVRILYVVFAVFPFVPGLLVYAVLWFAVPEYAEGPGMAAGERAGRT